MTWQYFLVRVNDVLTAGVGATAFALVLYFLFYNRRSHVAQALSGLLICVLVVYVTDLLLTDISSPLRAVLLLRLQWLGIAFTPPFYLEFIRSIHMSVMEEHYPAWLRPLGFVLGGMVALLALGTDLLVNDVTVSAGAVHLRSGPLFYPFTLFFGTTLIWGIREMLVARDRCYTRAARRRMVYLLGGFVAPAVGVFPYLLLTGWPAALPGILLWILLIMGNVAIAGMLVLMAYSVAFIGALTPDRVVKHRLVRFLLRGPAAAMLAMVAFGAGLALEQALGLAAHTLSLIAFAITVIIAQLAVELGKPLLDLALYRTSQPEVARVQELSQRLLTTADIQQFLENVLAAICELLRSCGGFLAILEDGQLQSRIWCDLRVSSDDLTEIPLTELVQIESQDRYVVWNGYWVIPIRDKAGNQLLGMIGLHTPDVELPLQPDQDELLTDLLTQASAALEDLQLQQLIFNAFSPLLTELQDIQRRGGLLRYSGDAVIGFSLTESPELPDWVHSALSHYWGGPRLTENPLLNLEVVKRAALEHEGNAIKGLRAVLSEALEQLRPDGERKLTTPEWLLYNILEMKFLRGQKVREVAMRLALSESDLYRKQKIAIENLAQIIANMEEHVQSSQN